MQRTPRRRHTPSLSLSPRHVWLATLGLAARSRRQAVALGAQAQAGVDRWRVRLGTQAVGLEQAVREIGQQLQTRLQPVLGRIGTPVRPKTAPRRAAKRSTRSAAKREPRVTPAKATTRSARRRRA